MEELNNYTNSNVKFLREAKKISQNKLASDLKIDQSTLGKWENNTRQITLEWSIKIAQYFKITLNDFVLKDLKKTESKISINDVKNNIRELPSSEMSEEHKSSLINMVDYFYNEQNKEPNKTEK